MIVPLVLRHTRRRPRGERSHPHSFVSRSVMLMRSRFVLKAESGVPALGGQRGREVVVLNSFSLIEVLKQMCLFVWKNKTHINEGRCVFLFFSEEGENTHVEK